MARNRALLHAHKANHWCSQYDGSEAVGLCDPDAAAIDSDRKTSVQPQPRLHAVRTYYHGVHHELRPLCITGHFSLVQTLSNFLSFFTYLHFLVLKFSPSASTLRAPLT